MSNRDGDVAIDAIGMQYCGLPADRCAPIMAHKPGLCDAQDVEQRHNIGDELVHAIGRDAAFWDFGEAKASQIGCNDTEACCDQRRDLIAPELV